MHRTARQRPNRRRPTPHPIPGWALLGLSLALLLVAGPATVGTSAAQSGGQPTDPDTPLVDEISVEVVNVDVVVTDKKGRPVTGLTADDFVIYEDGERREVSNFYSFRSGELRLASDDATASGDSAAESPWADQPMKRRMAFLFDNNSLEKRDRAKAIEGLEQFVIEQFDGSYEWAVIAYADELQLMQPFTDDKTTVLGALGRVGQLPIPVRRRRASDETMIERVPVVTSDARRGQRTVDQVMQELTLQDFDLRERMLNGLQEFDRTTAAIVQTVRAYMGLSGRKSLVLVTGSLQALPGGSQLLGRGLPTGSGSERADQMIGVIHGELLRRYEAIIKMANASGFSIYPISADALMQANSSYLDVERSPSLTFTGGFSSATAQIDVETASRTMAEGTGGSYYSTTNFYSAFDDIDDRTANSYVLGFATDHPAEGDYHPIRVESKREGLKVHYRQGYMHLSPEQQIAEELSTPLAFPKDRGDFLVKTQVFLPEEVRKKNKLTVAGLVPLRDITLVPRGDSMVGRIHLYVALYDPKGNLVNLFTDRQDVELPAEKVAEASDDVPARFGLTLSELPKGEYTVTVTVIDDITNRYGTGLHAMAL